jgi:hypothetical protein
MKTQEIEMSEKSGFRRFRPVLLASAVVAAMLVLPRPAFAWWHGGWGPGLSVGIVIPPILPPPVYYPPPPIYYAPPAAYYAPPASYAPPGQVWIPGHYNARGVFVPGHWALAEHK